MLKELDRSTVTLPGESKVWTVTPYFSYQSVFNEPQSALQGKPVHDILEVVELRFAANSNYRPIFLVSEMAEADEATGRIITWAEKYKAAYQSFLAGSEQEAQGTPLEELLPYGITQAQLSLCRALNIYSIEALAHIEGAGIKRLGIHGNEIKPMAVRYLEARKDGGVQQNEINELTRQLAEARGLLATQGQAAVLSTVLPEVPPQMPVENEDDAKVRLKDEIERLTGARPRGNPALATLESMLSQASQA